MTPEQKKQVTNDLVRFVSAVTYSPRDITKAEAMALPAVLDFLAKTDFPEIPYRIATGDALLCEATPLGFQKFTKSKE